MKSPFPYGILMLLVVLAGCQPDTVCRKEVAPQMKVGLCTIHHLTDGGTEVTTGVDSVTIRAIGNDSLIANNSKSVSQVEMPLRTDSSALTQFVMLYHETEDTVSVYHTNHLQYVSMECGCKVAQTIDSVAYTLHNIEQVDMTIADVTPAKDKNLIIYFRP